MIDKNKQITPPPVAAFLLKLFFPDNGEFTTLGDLQESFTNIVNSKGSSKAKWWYRLEVIKSIFPIMLHSFFLGISMFKNYIKIAWRNFLKYKTHSVINLLGLTFSLTAFILILLFNIDELSFDKFHKNYEKMGRIVTLDKSNAENLRYYSLTSGAVGEMLSESYPEISNYTMFVDQDVFGRFTVEYNQNQFYESDYLIVQPSFFKLFDFELLYGDRNNILNQPNEIVLTENYAKKLFGNENPIGKIIKTDREWGEFKVTGILKETPSSSHLRFSILISFSSLSTLDGFDENLNNLDLSSVRTYLLFNSQNDLVNFPQKLSEFEQLHKTEVFGVKEEMQLQTLSDIHFNSAHIEFDNNNSQKSITAVYILGLIGFFIILIAGINYSNLSNARYLSRAKEIGIRKVIGANKKQLFTQIFAESLLVTSIAVVTSLALAKLFLPTFNSYFNKNLTLSFSENFLIFGIMCLITILVALLSGSLPAYFLSKINIVYILKSKLSESGIHSKIKKALVVIQFAISILMIFSTVIVYNQLQFLKSKDLGFNKEEIVVIDINSGAARSNFETIKTEFWENSDVLKVSVSSRVPGDWKSISEIDVNNFGEVDNKTEMNFICADENFLNTFEISLANGENFSGNPLIDSGKVIVNSAALKALEINDPIGKIIELSNSRRNGTYIIAGVINDFHFKSLHENIGPLIIGYRNSPFDSIDYFSVKANAGNIFETITYLKSVHEKFDQTTPFEYNFLDERIEDFYQQERKDGIIINTASLLSIIIACMGLFGLAAFTAHQKVKEIGVRKVLGASVIEIVLLFSKEFVKLVFIAAIIALPLGYYFMHQWLNSFAYKINIGLFEIIIAGLATLFITLITISYQAIKAAIANPISSIRVE